MSAPVILYLGRLQPGPAEMTRQTGVVAEAIVFSDGQAVLHWLTYPRGTEVYPSAAEMRAVRESSGRSRFFSTAAEAILAPWCLSDDDSEAQADASERIAQFCEGDVLPSWGDQPLSAREAAALNERLDDGNRP